MIGTIMKKTRLSNAAFAACSNELGITSYCIAMDTHLKIVIFSKTHRQHSRPLISGPTIISDHIRVLIKVIPGLHKKGV